MKSLVFSVLLTFLLIVFFSISASAASKEFKKDLELVLDKVNDVLFSMESSISAPDFIAVCRNLIISIKKFNEKYPDDSVSSHNLNNILKATIHCSDAVSEAADSGSGIAVVRAIYENVSGFLVIVIKENKDGIKSGVKVDLSIEREEYRKKIGLKEDWFPEGRK